MIFGFVSAPEGATVTYTSDNVKKLEGDLPRDARDRHATTRFAGFPTVADGVAIAQLKPWSERTRKQQEIVTALMPKFGEDSRACARSRPTRPSLGPVAAQPAGGVRDHVAGALRGAAALRRRADRRGRRRPRACRTSIPTCASTSPSSR